MNRLILFFTFTVVYCSDIHGSNKKVTLTLKNGETKLYNIYSEQKNCAIEHNVRIKFDNLENLKDVTILQIQTETRAAQISTFTFKDLTSGVELCDCCNGINHDLQL